MFDYKRFNLKFRKDSSQSSKENLFRKGLVEQEIETLEERLHVLSFDLSDFYMKIFKRKLKKISDLMAQFDGASERKRSKILTKVEGRIKAVKSKMDNVEFYVRANLTYS